MIFKKLRDLWKKRLKNIYIIRERVNDDVFNDYYFKKSKNRFHVIQNLIRRDCEPHYTMWCDVHDHKVGEDSLMEYLQTVYVQDNKYAFINGKIPVSDARYTQFSYEAQIEKEKTKIKLELKQKNNEKK